MAGRLCLTGVVRIEDGEGERNLRGSQPRLVLVRTALDADHPVTADALAHTLWPTVPSHWEGAVRGVVAKVRSFLGATGVMDNVGHCYRFRRGDLTVDVEEAGQRLARAEAAATDGRWAVAAEAADRAVALLTDPLLPGVDADWLVPWQGRLDRRRERAQRVGALAHSALGHHEEARERAEAALERDPFDESSHRTLMNVLLGGGNRSEALLAYERLRWILAAELGVEPDLTTQALHARAIGSGPRDSAGDDRGTSSGSPPVPSPPSR